jgi:hypothetical protein
MIRLWRYMAAPIKTALGAVLLIVVAGLGFALGGWYLCGAPVRPIVLAVSAGCAILVSTWGVGARGAAKRAASSDVRQIERAAHEGARDAVLEQYLATRGEQCPSCGYDLHGLIGRHCPECGEPLRLRVGLDAPNLAPFIVGLCALAAVPLFSGIELLALGVAVVMSPNPVMSLEIPVVLVAEFVTGLVLIIPWVAAGFWIRRQAQLISWSLAMAAWLALILSIVLFKIVVYL